MRAEVTPLNSTLEAEFDLPEVVGDRAPIEELRDEEVGRREPDSEFEVARAPVLVAVAVLLDDLLDERVMEERAAREISGRIKESLKKGHCAVKSVALSRFEQYHIHLQSLTF